MDVLHPHVQGLYAESRVTDLGALRQKFCQQERVLATRESHEDTVIIFYQMISSHRLDEPLFQTLLQATALFIFIKPVHADACPYSGQHDDHRP